MSRFSRQSANLGRLRPHETVTDDAAEQIRKGQASFTVASSFLSSAQYNPQLQEMTFRFPSGFEITFGQFSIDFLDSFLAAPSKGQWYHQHIKAGYNRDGTWIYTLPVVRTTTEENRPTDGKN